MIFKRFQFINEHFSDIYTQLNTLEVSLPVEPSAEMASSFMWTEVFAARTAKSLSMSGCRCGTSSSPSRFSQKTSSA